MSNIIENIKIERNKYYFEDLTHEGSEEDPYLFPTISNIVGKFLCKPFAYIRKLWKVRRLPYRFSFLSN